jgi:hypothetical protein
VAILPDSVFFSRIVPVRAEATADEVAGEVSLVLEGLSPFPVSQLFCGYYWVPGSARALAFAAYRRRFAAEQVLEWGGAQHVIPAFAAVLGAGFPAATTAILSTAEGLTAVHWDKQPVPSLVLYRPLQPGATDEERAQARAELIKSAGEALKVVDLPVSPVALASRSDREVVFAVGDVRSVIPAATLVSMDVRDKAELAALARSRRRDLVLWRTATASILCCILLALGEAGLVGAGLWEKTRVAKMAAQRPTVNQIMGDQELANKIERLSTERLLPLEMISIVAAKKPATIQFLRATTSGLNTIQIEAQTNNAGEIGGYRSALEQTPGCDHVEIRDQVLRNNVASFTLIVTFKPSALAPATS